MVFGDKNIVAIECELTEFTNGFAYGRLRYWFNNIEVGNWNDNVILNACLYEIKRFLDNSFERHKPEFWNLSKEEVIESLWDWPFGIGKYVGYEKDNDELNDCYDLEWNYHIAGIGSYSFYGIAMVLLENSEKGQRCIWRLDDSTEVHECRMPSNAMQIVAKDYLTWLEKEIFHKLAGGHHRIFGDKSSFAIECELITHVRRYFYGRLDFWFSGKRMGDWGEVVTLDCCISMFDTFLNYPIDRRFSTIWDLTKEAVVDLIWNDTESLEKYQGQFRIDGTSFSCDKIAESIRIDYLGHTSTDDRLFILLEDENRRQRCVCTFKSGGEINDFILPPNTIQKVSKEFYKWLQVIAGDVSGYIKKFTGKKKSTNYPPQ